MTVKEEREKAGLKFNIQKTKCMAFDPITSLQIDEETMDQFKIGKAVHQGYKLSPCLFNLYPEYVMRNAGLDEAQAGIKIARKTSITSDM